MNDDLISRRAVLKFAKDIIFKYPDGTEYKHRCIDPDDVRKLPSAESEQKTGKWITYERECFDENTTEPWHKCKCGYETRNKTPYCPNCGARMDEE